MLENFFVSSGFALTCIGSLVLYYLPFCRKLQIALLVFISFIIYWLAAGNLIFLLLFCAISTALFSYSTVYAPEKWRKKLMVAGVISNLSLLIFFKYKHLLMPPSLVEGWFGKDPLWLSLYELALPIGISFYIFHSISLIVDSYHHPDVLLASGRNLPKHILKTMLYLTFFPQIVSGPIAKGKFFYPQIVHKRFADIDWTNALRALVHGYFLKEVIANNLNQLTAPLSHPEMWSTIPSSELLMMMFGYSAQIFADFAGYSLIAIGLGRLYGYELPINFNCPYFAHSFSNFWQRWHISLSSWLRDYLYIPLGGNRKGAWRTYCNLMIVMALGGLWHGPEWKYAIWGLIHGVALMVERLFVGQGVAAFYRIISIPFVFLYVTFAWLFFRLSSVHEVLSFISLIASWKNDFCFYHRSNMLLLSIFIGLVFVYHLFSMWQASSYLVRLKRYDGCLAAALLTLCLIAKGQESAFIYFQF